MKFVVCGVGAAGTFAVARLAELSAERRPDGAWSGVEVVLVDTPTALGRGRAFDADVDSASINVEDLLGWLDAMPAARDLGAASSQFSFPQDSGEVAGWVGLGEARQLPGVEGVGTIPDVGDVVGPDRASSYSRLAWAVATGPDAVSARARARAAVETVQPVLVDTTSARELGPAGERS